MTERERERETEKRHVPNTYTHRPNRGNKTENTGKWGKHRKHKEKAIVDEWKFMRALFEKDFDFACVRY